MSTIATFAAAALVGASVGGGVPPQPVDAGPSAPPFSAPQGDAAENGWLVLPFERDQFEQAKEQAGPAGASNPATGKADTGSAESGKDTEAPKAPPTVPATEAPAPVSNPAPAATEAPEAETPEPAAETEQGSWWSVIFGGFGAEKPGDAAKDEGVKAWLWTPFSWLGGDKETEEPAETATETPAPAATETAAPASDATDTAKEDKTGGEAPKAPPTVPATSTDPAAVPALFGQG